MCDCAVVNAYILWKTYQPLTDVAPRQQSLKNFRLSLPNGLIASYNSRQWYTVPVQTKEASLYTSCPPKKRAILSSTHSTSSTVQHFPIKGKCGKWHYCWNIWGERHETNVHCKLCRKALSIESRNSSGSSCFELHHIE